MEEEEQIVETRTIVTYHRSFPDRGKLVFALGFMLVMLLYCLYVVLQPYTVFFLIVFAVAVVIIATGIALRLFLPALLKTRVQQALAESNPHTEYHQYMYQRSLD